MANKAISKLPQAENVNNQDLFVLEQGGLAKKLTAETFITEQGIIDALAEALDGHGGIQSVTLSSVSGRIRTYRITFTDQSATTFQVYDGTTIERIAKTSTAGLVDTYTIFMNDGTTTFFTVTNGADGTVSEAMLNDALKDKAPAITETTESSAIANFTDGADNMVMHHVIAEINPVQDLSNGDPSPSNICPITGWTGCNVTRTGKNLLKLTFGNQVPSVSSGQMVSSNGWSSDFIKVDSSKPYVFSSNSVSTCYCFFYKSDGTYLGYYQSITTPKIIVASNYSRWNEVGKVKLRTDDASSAVFEAQFEIGATPTTYEPYQGNTVAVDWTSEAGTVYGGTIDVATGLLTVERVSITIDGTEQYWYAVDNRPNIYDVVFTNTDLAPINQSTDVLTNQGFTPTAYNYTAMVNNIPSVCLRYNESSQWRIYVATSNTTLAALKTYLGNNPLQIVYPLATPQTYQLTGQQLMTLLGNNCVWSDLGDVTVTYPADTKMYIQNLTQPTEDDMVANQAITSGKYFMIGNSLYLALANIASGAQITIGTNAQRVSLADALNTINS